MNLLTMILWALMTLMILRMVVLVLRRLLSPRVSVRVISGLILLITILRILVTFRLVPRLVCVRRLMILRSLVLEHGDRVIGRLVRLTRLRNSAILRRSRTVSRLLAPPSRVNFTRKLTTWCRRSLVLSWTVFRLLTIRLRILPV